MNFADIDSRLQATGFEQKELCERARVHPTTYSRLKKGRGPAGATERTLEKLKAALDELVDERRKALIKGVEDGKPV